MRALLERFLKEGKSIHIHLSRDFHLSGRLTSIGDGVVSLARDNTLYHIPIDKIIYVFESAPGGPAKSSGG